MPLLQKVWVYKYSGKKAPANFVLASVVIDREPTTLARRALQVHGVGPFALFYNYFHESQRVVS